MRTCIVSNSKNLIYALKTELTNAKYLVRSFSDWKSAYSTVSTEEFEIFIVDIDEIQDTQSIYNSIKKFQNFPVLIILFGEATTADKIAAYDMGADHIVNKTEVPVAEIVALVKATTRRKITQHNTMIYLGENVTVDLHNSQVFCDSQLIELSPIEYQILEYLLLHRGQVIDKSRIAERIWENSFDRSPNIVAVHIGKIRRKLKGYSELVRSIRGRGYKID